MCYQFSAFVQKHFVVAADVTILDKFVTAVSSQRCSCVRVDLLSVEEPLCQADCKMLIKSFFWLKFPVFFL